MSQNTKTGLAGIYGLGYYLTLPSDPTVAPGFPAPKGAVGVIQNEVGAPSVYQKQDDGETANWIPLGGGLPPFPGTTQYRVVDAAGGSNVSGDGSWNKPWQTIAYALTQIVGESTANRYCIIALPGTYADALVWRDFISLVGFGQDVTVISGAFSYPGLAGSNGRVNIARVGFNGAMTVDHSLATNINLRFLDCRLLNITYDGGDDYGVTRANNLFINTCSLVDLTIIDGLVHIYDNHAGLNSVTIGDGPRPASVVGLELAGGILQGAVNLSGRAHLYIRGALTTAAINGVIVGGVTPVVESDESSVTSGVITGDVEMLNTENPVINVGVTPYDITRREQFITAAGGVGGKTLNLPKVAECIGFMISVQKTDASNLAPLTVAAQAGEFIRTAAGDAASLLIREEGQTLIFVSDGLKWSVTAESGEISREHQLFSARVVWNGVALVVADQYPRNFLTGAIRAAAGRYDLPVDPTLFDPAAIPHVTLTPESLGGDQSETGISAGIQSSSFNLISVSMSTAPLAYQDASFNIFVHAKRAP